MSEDRTSKSNVRFGVTTNWWFNEGRDIPENGEVVIKGSIDIIIVGSATYKLDWEYLNLNHHEEKTIRLISDGQELELVNPYNRFGDNLDTGAWVIAYAILSMAIENNRKDSSTHVAFHDQEGKLRSKHMYYSTAESWVNTELNQEDLAALAAYCQEFSPCAVKV